MTTARAGTKGEAVRLLAAEGIARVELDYESGWQDAIELGRLGQKVGICVEYRGHENIAVRSHTALIAGQFALTELTAKDLATLEIKAMKLGDYILAGHLLRVVDTVWA
ncbi:PHA-granule associated protein 4 [Cupriavidus basilensis OR16]|uniref:PHA-granule associated protein 4 n=1 Tax=Cupriavidus basilensis OR16 TaxID=1127483 RepID=H1RZT2_9BURK|nr:hypothetical protein [Cupriavidus basilensis]EHP44148.1 PHA-granule associated protein 4 [Cupriavidus basilensis OR16]